MIDDTTGCLINVVWLRDVNKSLDLMNLSEVAGLKGGLWPNHMFPWFGTGPIVWPQVS